MPFLTYSISFFERWLLNFTDQVEVIAPIELNKKMGELSKRLFEHYYKAMT
jgi:hypothetical protein